jgi:glutathione S-transferase
MLLYGSTHSGHSYKVRSLLLLAGVAHEYRWIDIGLPRAERPAAFVAASKFGEVPVLVDDGRPLCQSNAILIHLARDRGLFCGQPEEWQSILEWLSWETNRIGFSVPNLRFALLWQRQPPDVLAYLESRAVADLQVLDKVLSETEYLLPSGPTIADISCSAYLFWLSQAGLSDEDHPNVRRWLLSLRNLPGWMHPDEALEETPGRPKFPHPPRGAGWAQPEPGGALKPEVSVQT